MRSFPALLVVLAVSRAGAEAPLPELRVACVQMEVKPQLQANLERIERGIAEAKAAGARMVLFPETALSGFDEPTIQALDWAALHAAMQRLAELAKANDVYVLYGTATESGKARPYNSAVLLGLDGAEIMRYHKMAPEDWFEPGDHLALFEVDAIPCTMIICHDNRFPELVRIPVLRGARICFYISYEINRFPDAVRKIDNYRAQLVARAAENGVWLAQANGVGPLDTTGSASLGHSRIIDPRGIIVRELPGMQEGMLVETLRPEEAKRGNAKESLDLLPLRHFWEEGLRLLP
ncbi:MAG: carbon-nitrogen hydrolase family protein [Candidatus Hydrogenedentes bacterium]|nr:carbon-nitrogen hydrolase family protein [Candidatus Hydrogenedentota bacterium]